MATLAKAIWTGNTTSVLDLVGFSPRYTVKCSHCGGCEGVMGGRKVAIERAKAHDVAHIQERLEAKA